MAVSPYCNEACPAYEGNYSGPEARTNITAITVHHMAGILSAAECGAEFQKPGRNGSSHYGIGVDGEIAWYVDEDCVAWTNSNWASNQCSVTIECSNCEIGDNWPVSDATFNSLIKLVADIAKRNGLGKLVPGENLTWHSMFAATTCPGDFLRERMQFIADKANELNEPKPAPAPEPEPTPEPEPDNKVWYTYKQGDTFGQVLKDLGLDENHLWGEDGTVKYYTDQLEQTQPDIFDANGNIKVGVPFYLIPKV